MKNKISLYLQIAVGIVFLISAYSKFISPGIIEIILIDHGIFHSRETAAIAVRVLIGLEFGIGFLFLQPYSIKKIVIPIAMLFLAGFTFYLVYTGIILKDSQNCGCFGEMIKMSPVESIVKNIFLAGFIIVVYKFKEERKKNYFLPHALLAAAIAVVMVTLPVQDSSKFVFSRYTNFAGAGRVDLLNGDRIVAVFNLECDHCEEAAREIAELKRHNHDVPQVYVLFFKEADNTPEKFEQLTNSNFPYTMITAKEFFDLIGSSSPRLYWLHNGAVKEYWDSDFVNHLKSHAEK